MITYVSRTRERVARRQLTRHGGLDGVNSIWEKVRPSSKRTTQKPVIQTEAETEMEHLLTQERCAQGHYHVASTHLVQSNDGRANEALRRLGGRISEDCKGHEHGYETDCI
ncbi:hypothetical protein J3458_015675 [Metarhizium acridum]|uniref:uncharacterized protein n=1 Tax=Metarhizium acridum TaxID=92637 RepID=UPI001C6AC4ED|nr:hypothetical protein J3458_015675 [Metarhizium acridum]